MRKQVPIFVTKFAPRAIGQEIRSTYVCIYADREKGKNYDITRESLLFNKKKKMFAGRNSAHFTQERLVYGMTNRLVVAIIINSRGKNYQLLDYTTIASVAERDAFFLFNCKYVEK